MAPTIYQDNAALAASSTRQRYEQTVNNVVRTNTSFIRRTRPDDKHRCGTGWRIWTCVESIEDAATSKVAANAHAPDIRDAWGDYQIILEREVERWALRQLRKRQAGEAA